VLGDLPGRVEPQRLNCLPLHDSATSVPPPPGQYRNAQVACPGDRTRDTHCEPAKAAPGISHHGSELIRPNQARAFRPLMVEVIHAEQTAGHLGLAGREGHSERIEDVIACHDGDGTQTGEDDHKIPRNAPTAAWPLGYRPDQAGRLTSHTHGG
jgi:hypothetical protein